MSFFRTKRAQTLRATKCKYGNCDTISFSRLGFLQTAQSALVVYAIPGSPTNVQGIAGNQQVLLTWTPPTNNGNSVITSYIITTTPGNVTTTSSGASATITGLTNGSTYTFTVIAVNSIGNSLASVASSPVTPITVPGSPTSVSASAGNGQSTVSWSAPASTGGSVITSYTVTSSPGNFTATSSTTSATVTGLTNGTSYTFTVVATNGAGNSTASTASSSITPITVPSSPTGISATAGNAKATVSWSAPASTGGSTITSYTVTSSPGNFTATSTTSPAVVTGLTNGTSYTFTVVATNGAGNSGSSVASSSVQPFAKIAGSLLFNGSTQYLSASPGMAFGSGSYSIELWFYNNVDWGSAGANTIRSLLGGNNPQCLSVFFTDSTHVVTDSYGGLGQRSYTVATVSLNAWHHFAIVRDTADTETVFIDGVKASSCASGTNIVGGQQTNTLNYSGVSNYIGKHYGGQWSGYITNYRVLVGSTAYDPTSTSIAVPSSALTAITNTKYLMLGDSITTDAVGIQTITNNNGITQTSTFVPF